MTCLILISIEVSVKGKIAFKGGTGSGNFGHSGRPGHVGGSGGGISSSAPVTAKPQAKPKTKKSKITIQQAEVKLQKIGYIMGRGRFDMMSKKAFYEVTKPDGTKVEMSSDEIIELMS